MRLLLNTRNMQNLPSGSKLSKLIKQCFKAPQGELFVGADFASLEDRINALLTKDKNKLKVYMGYKQYQLEINGVIHLISEDTMLEYDGNLLTGEELYEKLSNS